MNNDDNRPKKFVGLHAHSLSLWDSISNIKDHIDFSIKNGMNALAMTDHGHSNSFADAYMYVKKLKEKGIDFKVPFGTEAYFIPSLKDWNDLYEEIKKQRLIEKANKKKSKKEVLTTDEEQQEEQLETIQDDKEDSGTTAENEEETKSNKYSNPLYQRSHLVLLAKNSEGLKGIFRLVSESNIRGFYKYPRVDFDMLREYCKGNVIASSACLGGYLSKIIADNQNSGDWKLWEPNNDNFELIQDKLKVAIETFKDCLGEENFYCELQFNKIGFQHLVNQHLIEAAKRTNTKLIITVDSHYSNPDHWKEREIYKLLGYQQKFKGQNIDISQIPQKIEDLKFELYPKNAEQIWNSYKHYCGKYDFYNDNLIKEAIEITYDIAHNQIGEVEVDRRVKLPSIEKLIDKPKLEQFNKNGIVDEDEIALKELKDLCIQKLKNKGKANDEVYVKRLHLELSVVKHLKLAKYFLTTKKSLDIIGKKQILGVARGSGGASLICYLLKITGMDPIKYDLLFQRFLNFKKSGNADIDNDCSDRDEAIKLIKEYFGEDSVVFISTFSQLQIASLIKDLAKLYGLPFEMVNEYTKKMRDEALAVARQTQGFDLQQWVFTLDIAEKDSPSFNEFMEKVKDYPDFYKSLKVLFKQQRQISRHAGGVLLSHDIKNNMPLIRVNGEIQTPFADGLNARNLEDFGFLKFDFLGLGTLRMFEKCIEKILINNGNKYPTIDDIKKYYYNNLHPDSNNYDDMNVYETVYWNGKYAGIFQFVKKDVQDFTAKLKPTNIVDLASITSIFRPGALSAGVDKKYLENKNNADSIEYAHEKLKEVLGPTYNFIIFQEQTQLIFHKLAGYDLDETDLLRKLLNKKNLNEKDETAKKLEALRGKFIEGCKIHSGLDEQVSSQLFDTIKLYSSYNFNKCLWKNTSVETLERGKINIEDVKIGEHISSKNGFIKVKDVINNGVKKLYKVKTKGGKELICTLDHKIETPLGLKTLKEIIELDIPILVV